MNKQSIEDPVARVATSSEADQDEFIAYALEIEARRQGVYHPSEDELRAIDEGLAAAKSGELATDEEVEAVFAKYRRT